MIPDAVGATFAALADPDPPARDRPARRPRGRHRERACARPPDHPAGGVEAPRHAGGRRPRHLAARRPRDPVPADPGAADRRPASGSTTSAPSGTPRLVAPRAARKARLRSRESRVSWRHVDRAPGEPAHEPGRGARAGPRPRAPRPHVPRHARRPGSSRSAATCCSRPASCPGATTPGAGTRRPRSASRRRWATTTSPRRFTAISASTSCAASRRRRSSASSWAATAAPPAAATRTCARTTSAPGKGLLAGVSHLPGDDPGHHRHRARVPAAPGGARGDRLVRRRRGGPRRHARGDEPGRRPPPPDRLHHRQQPVRLLHARTGCRSRASTWPTAARRTASRASSSTAPTSSPCSARRSGRSRRRARAAARRSSSSSRCGWRATPSTTTPDTCRASSWPSSARGTRSSASAPGSRRSRSCSDEEFAEIEDDVRAWIDAGVAEAEASPPPDAGADPRRRVRRAGRVKLRAS